MGGLGGLLPLKAIVALYIVAVAVVDDDVVDDREASSAVLATLPTPIKKIRMNVVGRNVIVCAFASIVVKEGLSNSCATTFLPFPMVFK